MKFTQISYNEDLFKTILYKIFDDTQTVQNFISLITYDFISISGSSILQILQNELYKNSDLDIYIELNSINSTKCDIIYQLIDFLSIIFKTPNSTKIYYKNQISQYNRYYQNNNTHNININDTTYSSLKDYIRYYHVFTFNNKKVELIFIKSNIEHVLLNSFDYNIVKNYWKMHLIYSLNLFAIKIKSAKMTLLHFIKRIILGSKRDMLNFINRYTKYSERGYKIFIHKTHITPFMFNHIVKMYYNKMPIVYNYNTVSVHTIANYNQIYFYLDNKRFLKKDTMNVDIFYKNNKIIKLYYSFYTYVLKYILINGIVQKIQSIKKLNNYALSLVNDYLHPNSLALQHKIQDWDNEENENKNNTKILYLIDNKLMTMKLQ